jgi:CHAT domain-containing protein
MSARAIPAPAARAVPRALAVLAAFLLLGACQGGQQGQRGMSLDEAKKVTTTFQGSSFVPPPRTITDVSALLDRNAGTYQRELAADRAAADRAEPGGLTGLERVKFYQSRGLAASRIGRSHQWIEDLTTALRGGRAIPGAMRAAILTSLSIGEGETGRYSDAVRHRQEALDALPPQTAGNRNLGYRISLHGSLAVAWAALGDMPAASRELRSVDTFLPQITAWQDHTWVPDTRAGGHASHAKVLALQGRYRDAEARFREALAQTESATTGDAPGELFYDLATGRLLRRGDLRRELARVLLRQGWLAEAEVEVRSALRILVERFGRDSSYTAGVLVTFVEILAEQGRFDEAETVARVTVSIYERIGASRDSLGAAHARRGLAEVLLAQGRWSEALAEFDAIERNLAGDPQTFRQFFAGQVGWILALVRSGQAATALERATAAVADKAKLLGDKHAEVAQLRGIAAMALAETGQPERALAEFRAAVPILLTRSREAQDEDDTRGARSWVLQQVLEAYISVLADAKAGDDAAAEAFQLAEVARGQAVERALNASAARAAAKDPALADLVRREQDAQQQVAALFGLLANILAASADAETAARAKGLRTQIDQLRGARAALAGEIERRFPAYASLVRPKAPSIQEIRASLRSGETLIAFYVGEARTFVWAVPIDGPVAFAATPLGRPKVREAVAHLRQALAPDVGTLGEIPTFDLAAGHALYTNLLGPVEPAWKPATTLLVVAHDALGQLPLTLLPTAATPLSPERAPLFARYREVPWLVRTHAVTVLPSATSLLTLRNLPPGDLSRQPFVGFGDPVFSAEPGARQTAAAPEDPGAASDLAVRGLPLARRASPKTQGVDSSQLAFLPRLPETADELRAIAVALEADVSTAVFTGAQANEATVKRLDLSGYRVLAFATHGLVPGDLDGLTQPALALSAPAVAGVDGDGLLTMDEILALRLNADWVVLSACNTASAQGAGSEAISGLGRAFFYAGARALLVSHWPVETSSARLLTTELFRRQSADPGVSRAQALRQTILWLLDSQTLAHPRTGRVAAAYAHPLFWAPFALVGDGGGTETQP